MILDWLDETAGPERAGMLPLKGDGAATPALALRACDRARRQSQ